jgi:hypothetical protein
MLRSLPSRRRRGRCQLLSSSIHRFRPHGFRSRRGTRRDGKTMSPDQRDGASMVRRHPAADGAGGLSIVMPVYNEAAGLAALHARVCMVAVWRNNGQHSFGADQRECDNSNLEQRDGT